MRGPTEIGGMSFPSRLEPRGIYVIAGVLLPQEACLPESGAEQGAGNQTRTPVESPDPAVPQTGFSVVWVKPV